MVLEKEDAEEKFEEDEVGEEEEMEGVLPAGGADSMGHDGGPARLCERGGVSGKGQLQRVGGAPCRKEPTDPRPAGDGGGAAAVSAVEQQGGASR